MAFDATSSAGYQGSVDEVQWARMSRFHGSPYAVGGPSHWKVSLVSGVDRTVRVEAGEGYGYGVRDELDTAGTLQLPTLASGTRWDLVCARRTWGPGAATTFTSVSGTNALQLPAGRMSDPGTVDDQPLALVRVTAGQQVPTSLIDLRPGFSDSLLAYPDTLVGEDVTLASGVVWHRVLDTVGVPTWRREGALLPASAVGGSYAGQHLYMIGDVTTVNTNGVGYAEIPLPSGVNGVKSAGVGSASAGVAYNVNGHLHTNLSSFLKLGVTLWNGQTLAVSTRVAVAWWALVW